MTAEQIKVALQYCYPKHALSRLIGWLAAAEAGPLTRWVIRRFVAHYKVDMNEAAQPELGAYPSFNAFFTRALAPDARPIDNTPDSLVMPVDGAISQLGAITEGEIFQAKGHTYSAQALLGGDNALAQRFQHGQFITIYLSPRDYHRIHMPVAGQLRKMIYVPGELFSVNPATARNIPGLFARNERVCCVFDTAVGPMVMVLVGATIVASIETVWSGTVTPPRGSDVFSWDYPATGDNAIALDKGEEMGRFKLGSTVVLLFAEQAIEFLDHWQAESPTRLGQGMATVTSNDA